MARAGVRCAVQDAIVTAVRKRSQLARLDNPEAWVRNVALNSVRHDLADPRFETWPPSSGSPRAPSRRAARIVEAPGGDGVGFVTDDGGSGSPIGSGTDRLGALGEPGFGYGDRWPLMPAGERGRAGRPR